MASIAAVKSVRYGSTRSVTFADAALPGAADASANSSLLIRRLRSCVPSHPQS